MKQTLRKKSVLLRTFIYIGVLLLLAFLFFELRLAQSQLLAERKTSELTVENIAQKTSSLFDMIFYSVRSTIEELTSDETIVNTVLLPDLQNANRNFNTLENLNKHATDNRYISHIILHNTLDDSVYTSDKRLLVLKDYHDQYLFSENAVTSLPETEIEMFQTEDALCFRYPFMPSFNGYLSTFLIMLDKKELLDTCIGDDLRYSVFLGDEPLYIGGEATADNLEQYSYYSQISGLTLCYPKIQQKSVNWLALASEDGSLTIMIVLFLILLTLALMVAWLLYRPLHTILKDPSVSVEGGAFSATDEWGRLSAAIQNKNDKNLQYKTLLSGSAYDICRQLFVDILDGIPHSEEEITLCLDGLKNEEILTGRYFLILLIPNESETDLNPLLQSVVNSNLLDDSRFAWIYHKELIVLLHAPEQPSQVAEFISAQRNTLERLSQSYCSCSFGTSSLFYSLTDLSFFFREAYRAATDSLPQKTNNNDPDQSFYAQIRHVADSIPDKPQEEIMAACDGILDQIYASTADQSVQIRIQVFFLKTLYGIQKRYSSEEIPNEESILASCQSPEAFKSTVADILSSVYASVDKRKNKYVMQAVVYLENHYRDSSLTLASVAEGIGVNSSYLSRLFSNAYHQGFNQYLNEIRVEKAKELLRENNMLIQEISSNTGFATVQTFMRVFKKIAGVTPNEYRKTQSM